MSTTEKDLLRSWLQTALELELATIPPYLIALLSIRLPANREAAELVRSVMVEEMLHVALVANVLVAVGGRPRFDRAAISTYPLQMTFEGKAFSDRRFPIDLAPFSEEAVSTFLKIELPRAPVRKAEFTESLVVPGFTIGEFYQKIIDLLESIAKNDAEGLFEGDSAWQVDASYYWAGGGRINRVVDLATAKQAMELVVEQGEGAWKSAAAARLAGAESHFDIGHYFRFNQIFHQRRYRPDDDPNAPPTGEPILVDYEAVYPIRPNPSAADYEANAELKRLNQMFNRRYTVMLMQLEEAFSGTPKTLYTAIMDSMHELPPLAHAMMRRPYPGDTDGRRACPTFEWSPPGDAGLGIDALDEEETIRA